MHRRTLIAGALTVVTWGRMPVPVSAAGVLAFDLNAFKAAQESGESLVVFVHAPW